MLALELLGDRAADFAPAVDRYVHAIEVADHARRQWGREGRPIVHRHANGLEGVSPFVAVMDRLDASAARYGAALGLDPASAVKVGRGVGRPAGANSAADRKPPPVRKLRSV